MLVGTATKDAGVAYQPFAETLDHLFLTSEAGTLEAAGELRGCPGTPPDTSRTPPSRRRRPPRPVRGGGGAVPLDRPRPAVVVVLDDLHWAQLPTVALLEHVVHSCLGTAALVLGTFRTTAPDRSDELSARLADLHRLDGVRRLDLAGLDTDAIAEFVSERAGVSPAAARAPAAILRDRTGGNPFFLRETWLDLERHGSSPPCAARSASRPPSGDTVAARLAGLGPAVRETVDLAAVIGDSVDLRDPGPGRRGRPRHEHGRDRRGGRGGRARAGGRHRW